MTHETLSESQKHEWIDDQIRKGGAVFCPWCSSMNRPGDEAIPCCTPFRFAVKDRADAMVRSFASQYTAVEVGLASSITCPYCKEVNRAPAPQHPAEWKRPGINPFCCDTFCMVLLAHLEVKRVQGLVHQADQLAEAMDKAAKN